VPALRGDGARTPEFLAVYLHVLHASGRDESAMDEARKRNRGETLPREFIHEVVSRINGRLETALGHLARHVHGIVAAGERGESEYSLAVPAERIVWEE
jgi:hypothetical protein